VSFWTPKLDWLVLLELVLLLMMARLLLKLKLGRLK
jgi:hypothetical protein